MSKLQTLILVVALGLSAQLEAAQWRKASDWLGMVVVTSNGDNVGKVEDFALDLETGEVTYVVVSVGSFLIKDALIAVAPAAMSIDAGRLVIAADSVSSARRFGEDTWPDQPDVMAGSNASSGAGSTEVGGNNSNNTNNDAVQPGTGLPSSGMATISSNRRTATLSADERKIEDVQPVTGQNSGSSAPTIRRVPNGPLPSFGALDRNRNGVLNRLEIGSWLTRSDSYDEVDLDSSGTVDRFEFDIFSAQYK